MTAIWTPSRRIWTPPSRQRGFIGLPAGLGAARPGGETDPYFANVSLLLHGDGADGSTSIIDSSPSPKTVNNVGSTTLSTTQAKFGPSSISLNGTTRYIWVNSSGVNFGSGDFTVEGWVYQSANSNGRVFYDSRSTGAATTGFAVYFFDGTINVYSAGANQISASGGTISINTWSHIAISRQGTAFRVFVGGALVATWTTSATFSANFCTIGRADPEANQYFAGYIDELRITKGVARYTSSFTPPTAAFPNS